jgi:hypothetical protein
MSPINVKFIGAGSQKSRISLRQYLIRNSRILEKLRELKIRWFSGSEVGSQKLEVIKIFGLRSSDFGLRTSVFGLRSSDFSLRTSVFGLRTSYFQQISFKHFCPEKYMKSLHRNGNK